MSTVDPRLCARPVSDTVARVVLTRDDGGVCGSHAPSMRTHVPCDVGPARGRRWGVARRADGRRRGDGPGASAAGGGSRLPPIRALAEGRTPWEMGASRGRPASAARVPSTPPPPAPLLFYMTIVSFRSTHEAASPPPHPGDPVARQEKVPELLRAM